MQFVKDTFETSLKNFRQDAFVPLAKDVREIRRDLNDTKGDVREMRGKLDSIGNCAQNTAEIEENTLEVGRAHDRITGLSKRQWGLLVALLIAVLGGLSAIVASMVGG